MGKSQAAVLFYGKFGKAHGVSSSPFFQDLAWLGILPVQASPGAACGECGFALTSGEGFQNWAAGAAGAQHSWPSWEG